MKEEKTKSKKKLLYYFILAVSVLLLAAATVLTVYFVSGPSDNVLDKPPVTEPDDPNPPVKDPDKPTGGDDVQVPKYVAPLAKTAYSLAYSEIYTNETVGWSYRHKAIDFAAEAGTDVYAMADGEVESVSYSEETGNVVTIVHADGLKSLYRFVEPAKGLGKGDTVKKGEIIGKVAEAYGSEYKDGPHLHFAVFLKDKAVNPTDYFEAVLEEK